MVNVCVICGEVDSEPEFRMQQEKLHSVTFNVDICDQGESYGWVKVFCLKERTDVAVRLKKGNRVVVGPLILGSRKAGEEVWWEEVMVSAKNLEVIE